MKNKLILTMTVTISLFLVLLTGCIKDESIARDDIPIFLYHSVKPEVDENDNSTGMVVSSENFEADLKYLKDNGYTSIDLDTLKNAYDNPEVVLPDKPVVITFDDGYLDNYEHAYPLLKKYDSHAVIYTIVWSVGRDKFISNDEPIIPHFTWEQAKEMVDSGIITLGSHTYDMHSPEGYSYGYDVACGYGLDKIEGEDHDDYYKRIYEDLKKSKELIESNTGRKINSLAYPYGIYNDTVIDVSKDLGFELGFITESDEGDKSVFEISRKTVNNSIRVSDILGK